ncbi:BZ3501_MvSof-1269-A2-R1_Chr8-1g09751 [Microbotryum saponariae]|nr:BZ3501_MvSof-1269-A2-R1_Chr8-1g09751 [Microbotryum saponariae]
MISVDLGHARPVTAVARVFTHDGTAALETFRFGKEGPEGITAQANRKGARQRANKTRRINEALQKNKLAWCPLATKLGLPLRHTYDAISVSSTQKEDTVDLVQTDPTICKARRPNQSTSSPPTHPETATYGDLLSKESRPVFLVLGNGFTSPGPNPSGALGLEYIGFYTGSEYLTSKLCWHLDCRNTDGTRSWVGLALRPNGSTCFRVALGGGTCVHMPADRDIMGSGNCLNAFEHEILWGRHPFFRSAPAAVQASQDQQ